MNFYTILISCFEMDCYNDKIENLEVFEEKTTYRNDYKRYCGYKKEVLLRNVRRSESPELPPKIHEFEDHETFAKWKKGSCIPFDLLWDPKPITQTNPHQPFQKMIPPEDESKEKAIKTRPRIYMTPAASIDDVADPEMRKLLCDFMYTTEWRKAEIEATTTWKKLIPKIDKIESEGDTVNYQVDLYKPIQEKYTKIGKSWDDDQQRGSVDPTAEFWTHKDPPVVCGACVNPLRNVVPQEMKNEISKLISKEKLRLAHDYPIPTYQGYRPMLAKGVPLSKNDLPSVHPFLSTSQAITARYAEDMKKDGGN